MEASPDRLRWSLGSTPKDDRVALLSEVYGPALNMEIVPLTAEPVFELEALKLPGVVIVQSRNSAHRVTRKDVSRENDDLVLAWSRCEGRGRMTCLGHEVRDGAPYLASCGDAFTANMHSEFQVVNVRIRRSLIAPLLPKVEDAFMRPISRKNPALRLLTLYLETLRRADVPESPEYATAVAAHICDLVALSVGAARDVETLAATRSVRAARLATVKRWVLTRLDDPGLSVAEAAAAEKVSASYIQMLFEDEGTTFSAFVLKERLARVHHQLANPSSAWTSVSAIAFDAGFGDLSYFNRSFRAAYDESPSDVRQRAALLPR